MLSRLPALRSRTEIRPTHDTDTLVEQLQHLASAALRPVQPPRGVTQLDRQAAIVQITTHVSEGARILCGLANAPGTDLPNSQDISLLDAVACLHEALSVLCSAALTTVDAPTTTPVTVTSLPR